MRWLLIGAFLASATAISCGSPSKQTGSGFSFTPVPYTFIDGFMGTRVPVSLPTNVTADRCYPYIANEVLVDVVHESLPDLKAWLDSVGFSVIEESDPFPPPDPVSLIAGVPLGSVPDAAAAIRARPGVTGVGQNSLGKFPEEPNLPVCPTRASKR